MNYVQVKAKFTGLMNRRDLTSNTSLVETFMQDAITRIQRELRIPAMEKALNITWTEALYPNGNLPIPDDLLELKEITYVDACNGYTLREEALSLVMRENIIPGHPTVFARRGAYYLLGNRPTAGDQLGVDYYAEFDALEEDSDTNFLTLAASDMLAYAACVEAATYFKDERLGVFDGKYNQCLEAIQSQADMDELTVGAAVAPTYHFGD
jgi:hypothetical protein